jgi:tight adherence protein B
MNWFDSLLGPGNTPLAVFGLIAAACAGLVLAALSLGESERKRRQTQRLERVRSPRRMVERRGPGNQIVRRDASLSRFEALNSLMRRVLPNVGKLRRRLEQTGRSISLDQYLLAGLALGILATIAAIFLTPLPIAADVLIGVIFGIGFPYTMVGWMAKRRLAKFLVLFPDAIDLIVRAVRSGQPVSEAIRTVGDQAPQPVGGEFRQVRDAMKVGMTLPEALAAAAERLDMLEFRFFNIALNVQQETGGNLSETLENLSKMLRRRRQVKMKIKAASAEARASAWIVGALPFVMFGVILTLNRDYAMMLVNDTRGIIMSIIGILMTATGMFIMSRMAKFEI